MIRAGLARQGIIRRDRLKIWPTGLLNKIAQGIAQGIAPGIAQEIAQEIVQGIGS